MTQHTNSFFHQKDQEYYLPTFRRFPITLNRGKGAYVWDVEGKKYIDALAGIAVNNIGHAHPKIVSAICNQADKLLHVSNFFVTPQQVNLSEKLLEISGLDRVFLTNSGAESLEGAIKVARRFAHKNNRGGTVISFTNSFHGRTMATIATGQKKYQNGFEPIPGGFIQAEFNNIESVKKLITDDIAAILIEPIQGEGGINPADKPFLQDLRELCDEHGIVLIFDEVQCGIGRTGRWFAKDIYNIRPDIVTLAKGLGGGVPIGAFLTVEKVSEAIEYGDHGTTFGGNPLVCAASLATLEVIEDEGLLKKVREDEAWLRDEIERLNLPGLKEVRGHGLMIGIEFEFETKPLVLEMLQNGVIANATAGNVLRLVPPLIITREQMSEVLRVLQVSLQTVKQHAQ